MLLSGKEKVETNTITFCIPSHLFTLQLNQNNHGQLTIFLQNLLLIDFHITSQH